jgi:hypothetical protein
MIVLGVGQTGLVRLMASERRQRPPGTRADGDGQAGVIQPRRAAQARTS